MVCMHACMHAYSRLNTRYVCTLCMQHVFCVFENSIYSSLLSNSLDDKLRLDGAPQRHAKTTDAWALFAVRDACVCAFLRAKLSPTYAETLETTTTLLKESRKKGHVNSFLFAMLGEPPGTKDKQHTLTHTRAPLDSSPPFSKIQGLLVARGLEATIPLRLALPSLCVLRTRHSRCKLANHPPTSHPLPSPLGGCHALEMSACRRRVCGSRQATVLGRNSHPHQATARIAEPLRTSTPPRPSCHEPQERRRRDFAAGTYAFYELYWYKSTNTDT